MCYGNELFLPAVLLTVFLFYSNQISAKVYEINFNATQTYPVPRALISKHDAYVNENQKSCLESRSLVSCIKYKAAKFLWKLATNSFGLFPNEYGRDLRNDTRRIRIIQLAEPSDILIFNDFESRNQKDDSAWQGIVKFLKRAAETFGRNHALQISLNGESGARVSTGEVGEEEGRGKKKLKKWLIILPIIILWKIAHLKMTVVTLLFGVMGLNVLLIGGTAWLIHYLKYKTLCKIHPHLVQSHSHVYDSDPADYSSFVGSSFPASNYHGYSSGGPHEVNIGGYSKDWGRSEGNSKAYSGYNYLDTISKRLQ